MITSRFSKQKNRSWQQKYQKHIPIEKISTTHDMSIWKSKLKKHLFMHHQIKRDRRGKSKEKLPLAWMYSFSWENILGFKEIYAIIFETLKSLLTKNKFLRLRPPEPL